jgi:anti-sigma B factor antagonist
MELQVGAPFTISVRHGDGAVVLDIIGEFDMGEVDTFHICVDAIIATGDDAVVLDLAGVSFIDSSAISALLTTHRCLTEEGRELRLQNFSAPVTRILELTGLTSLISDTATSDSPSPHQCPS